MKRWMIAGMLLLAAGLQALAGEPYTCLRPGRTLVYERTKTSNGRLERTVTMQYTGVRSEDGKRYVDYVFTMRGPGGGVLYGGATQMTTVVTADGTTLQDLGASLQAVLHNMFPGAEQEVESEMAQMPATMKPGDRLPDAHCTVKTGIMTHSIDIIEREVLRFERVSVPAGDFDCVVLREHKIERGLGRNRDTVSENWYAPGIGPVRHDSYKYNRGNPQLEATEVLKKY